MSTAAAIAGDNGSTTPDAVIANSAVNTDTNNTVGVNVNTGASTINNQDQITNVKWLGDVDELTLGYIQNKGWTEPKQILDGYRNLEKLFGADKAGNTVILPKAEATPEELSAFYSKLGRPVDADGYGIKAPEGMPTDPAFTKAAADKFYELGLSQKQGQELTNWWNNTMSQQMTTQQNNSLETFQKDEASLKTEWGNAYDQNFVVAKNVATQLGLDAPTIDKLQGALGHAGVMKLLANIGSKSGEDKFVTGQNSSSFSSVMTPAQAKADIQAKMADKTFASNYLNKNADALAEMARLHAFAYPEER